MAFLFRLEMADGAPAEPPKPLAPRTPGPDVYSWTDGDGVFHVSARSVEVNYLQLRALQEEISLKGSVSFGREADLTLDSVASRIHR